MAPDNNAVPAVCPTVAQLNPASTKPKRTDGRQSGFQARHIARRLARFIASDHKGALNYARSVTRDWDVAERALAETYQEVIEGRAVLKNFYHALKMNATNLLARRSVEHCRFNHIDAVLAQMAVKERQRKNREDSKSDFPSHWEDDRDPLVILIERDEQALSQEIVKAALRTRHWQFCKRRRWARPLLKCAEFRG